MPNEYEIELCYKMMAFAHQSSKIDMRPSQIKKIMSLFFDDDVIAAVVVHFEAGTRPTPRALDLANRRVPENDCDHRTPGVMCDFCNPPSQ